MYRMRLIGLMVISVLLAVYVPVHAESSNPSHMQPPLTQEGVSRRLIDQIRKELVTLPYYDVFDWLEAEVKSDDTVILRGYVTRPTTKSAAEARVKRIEGVERVINEIEVLPVSPNDDRLRLALYIELFKQDSPLFRYAQRALSPIHIIVKNGRATLKGMVATEQEKQIAYLRAQSVPGVFEVKNDLRVETEE